MLSFHPTLLNRRRAAVLAAAPLLALLTACGGGGGSPGNTNTYNLDAAITRVLQGGLRVDGLSGRLNGVDFTLSMQFTPLPDGVFEGVSRRAARQAVTINGGGSSETTVDTLYYATGPYVGYGSVDSDGAPSVFTTTGNLPTVARVGDSGPLNTGVDYADASKRTVTATSRSTWSLDADTETTALACLRSQITEAGSSAPITGAQCFRINTAGEVLGAVITVGQGGFEITFR